MEFKSRSGFTLIELLIVVAIIAILAAIAIPNMLEAQTRAKVSRVLADHRTLVTGMELYRLDQGNYPISVVDATTAELFVLSTPTAYLSSIPMEPFNAHAKNGVPFPQNTYDMVRYQQTLEPVPILHTGGTIPRDVFSPYVLVSVGPDNRQEENYIFFDIPDFLFVTSSYDPTNGSVSKGDIYTFGGASKGH